MCRFENVESLRSSTVDRLEVEKAELQEQLARAQDDIQVLHDGYRDLAEQHKALEEKVWKGQKPCCFSITAVSQCRVVLTLCRCRSSSKISVLTNVCNSKLIEQLVLKQS